MKIALKKPGRVMNIKRMRRLVGERIKAVRKKRRLTQEKLAERAQLDTTFIAYIEAGKKSSSLNSLMKISTALRIPFYKLFAPPDKKIPLPYLNKAKRRLLETLEGRSAADKRLIVNIARQIYKPSGKP